LLFRDLVASKVSASLDLQDGKLKISDWRADLLGGKHRGDWRVDFAAGAPVYSGTGTLAAISLEEAANAMGDPWISGIAGGNYQIAASGVDSATFWQSAAGSLQFEMRDGILSHISLSSGEGPLHVMHWQGRARLHSGKFEIEPGKLVAPAGAYEIGGTASLGRVLDFKLARGAEVKRAGALVYSITGTVADPLVTVTPAQEAQARLKP
jgi:hypothetical protein